MSVRVEIETGHTAINGTQYTDRHTHAHTARQVIEINDDDDDDEEKNARKIIYIQNKINFIASFFGFVAFSLSFG